MFFAFCPSPWAQTMILDADNSQFQAEKLGRCDLSESAGIAAVLNWTGEATLWELTVRNSILTKEGSSVFYLNSPFYFEAAVKLPHSSDWLVYVPMEKISEIGWPAALAVFPLTNNLSDGEKIELCLSGKISTLIKAKVSDRINLRKQAFNDIRLSSLTEGTLFALTLAALGLALLIQRIIFLIYASGIAMALLFVVASNGSLLDLPGGVWLAREFPVQRIAGISSTILITWALARFLSIEQRHPSLWRIFIILLGAMGGLLVMDLLPTPLRYVSFSLYSNAIMAMLIVLVLASAIVGSFIRHRASLVLLVSWGPVLIVTLWMSTNADRDSSWSTLVRWLFTAALVYACSFLFTELARRLAETQSQRDLARQKAMLDDLTGALTRDAIFQKLENAHSLATQKEKPYSVLFIDLDHFKKVNDTFGHAIGDAALVVAMQQIMKTLRSNDSVGRYGGEEFLVLLEGLEVESAKKIAERICADIANEAAPLRKGIPPLTVSIGIADASSKSDIQVENVIERADKALYTAKQEGRNRVVVAD